jgi:DNA invertase Pin-like site-specific DNA recombinase
MNSELAKWEALFHRLTTVSEAEFAPVARLAEEARQFRAKEGAELAGTEAPPEAEEGGPVAWRRGDPELTRLIASDYQDGLTQSEIAAKHGVHVQTVSRHLTRGHQTLRTRKARLTPDQLAEAKRLQAQGWTTRRLGERYHMAHTTIARLLARNGGGD